MCVCPPPRALINNGVIWCDIGRMRLIKQVLWLSLLLITLYVTLAVNKMDGRGHNNTARRECLKKETKVT